MVKDNAQILVAGPAVVSRAFGTDFTKEELGGSDVHKKNGVTDNIAESEEDAFNQIKKFLVQRYGEFILFKPLFNMANLLLWATPLISFILIAFIAIRKTNSVSYTHLTLPTNREV